MCIVLTKSRIEYLAWTLLGIGLIVIVLQVVLPNKLPLALLVSLNLVVILINFILLLASSKYIDFIPNPQVLQPLENKVRQNFEPSVSGKMELKGEIHEIRVRTSNNIIVKSITLFRDNLLEIEKPLIENNVITIKFSQKRRLDVDFKIVVEGELDQNVDVAKRFIEFEILYSVKILSNLIPIKFLTKIRVS